MAKAKSKQAPRMNYSILRKGGQHGKSTKAKRRNEKVQFQKEAE